jgi:hypothetical protein
MVDSKLLVRCVQYFDNAYYINKHSEIIHIAALLHSFEDSN